jgi:hypothetical protein
MESVANGDNTVRPVRKKSRLANGFSKCSHGDFLTQSLKVDSAQSGIAGRTCGCRHPA